MLISCIKGSFRSSAFIAVCSGWQGWQIQVSWVHSLTCVCVLELWEGHSTVTCSLSKGLCAPGVTLREQLSEPGGGFISAGGLKQDGCVLHSWMGRLMTFLVFLGCCCCPVQPPQEKGAGLSLAELEVLQPPPGIKLSVSILLHCVFLHQGWKGLSLICFSL